MGRKQFAALQRIDHNRKITQEEYDAVLSWMYLNDLEGFVQEEESADTCFIPDF